MEDKTYILNITPQTNVRSTQNDGVLFRIPEENLRPAGLKRKLRLEKYNRYKEDLFDLALEQGFTIPDEYFHVIFYIPVRKTFRKWKKEALHLRPHKVMPDGDNLFKAFLDALKKRDQVVFDFRVTKVWINEPQGHIEIIIPQVLPPS